MSEEKEKTSNLKQLASELGISRNTLTSKLSESFRKTIKLQRNQKFLTALQVEEIKKELGYL